jgi:hypothetical protein
VGAPLLVELEIQNIAVAEEERFMIVVVVVVLLRLCILMEALLDQPVTVETVYRAELPMAVAGVLTGEETGQVLLEVQTG